MNIPVALVGAGTMQVDGRALNVEGHLDAQLRLRAPQNGAAVLCFTSGTTAAPKAAVLAHTAFHVQSLSKLLNIGYCRDDVYYHAAPLCHIGKPAVILPSLPCEAQSLQQNPD